MNSQTKFRSLKSLAMFLSKNSVDNFIFNNLWFTMDYYDMQGKVMTYGNISNNLTIECNTEDRYKSRKDMVCDLYDMIYSNDNITYIN
jgi:hypothetical protein